MKIRHLSCRRLMACGLSSAMLFTGIPAAALNVSADAEISAFAQQLAEEYATPAEENKTEVRWWLACGTHTDETIKEEIAQLYEEGFSGFELCLLDEEGVDNNIYGYGSEEWAHDVKTAITEATKYGMSVGLTSGTHWHDANIPGLDPNSEAAGQEAGYAMERVAAGASRSGELTLPANGNAESAGYTDDQVKRTLIGVYAYEIVDSGAAVQNEDGTYAEPTQESPMVFGTEILDLTDQVVASEDGSSWSLDWTNSSDSEYMLVGLWQQGTFQVESPAQEQTFAINYYNEDGVEALEAYLESYIFDDEELAEAIKEGNVQFFMDSLEINNNFGRSLYWASDMAEEFLERKGYDIRPYLALFAGIGTGSCFAGISSDVNAQPVGPYVLEGETTDTWQIMNDFYDVQTQLIQEELIEPLNEWGKENYNMGVRTQNPYGTYMEISEMAQAADYTETETLNMKDQTDIYRLWSGGAHIMDKLYSSETGAISSMTYALTEQDLMYMCYNQFAAGVNRIIWHGHSSSWGPDEATEWPGHNGMSSGISMRLDTRQPGSINYSEMNDHLGRIQQLLREGVSRTDVGILHIRYGENTAYPYSWANALQEHTGYYWTDTGLQDAGYTYDYFSPAYLMRDDMQYDAQTGTLGENVGYQAILLDQQALPVEYAQKLLELATEGLKVVIVGDAGTISPYSEKADGETDEELAEVMDQLKALDNVVCVETEADATEALAQLGIRPRAELVGTNTQLLTQMREEDGNKYLYVYNYCNGENCGIEHTDNATVEVSVEGTYIPYEIDSWTGEVEKVANYRQEDGRTIITVDLDYMNVALYAFEADADEELHVVSTDAEEILNVDGSFVVRSTVSGTSTTTLSDGTVYTSETEVPAGQELENWDLTVEDWTKGEKLTRSETRTTTVYDPETDTYSEPQEVETVEIKWDTNKETISVHLDTLKTWDEIEEIGKDVSGIGYYSTTFDWDAEAADGAYLDMGEFPQNAIVEVNGQKTDPVSATDQVVDIGDLLKDGENTLEITVSTTLTNRLLQMGVITEKVSQGESAWDENAVGFNDYSVHYFSNGLSSVKLVPYTETVLGQDAE